MPAFCWSACALEGCLLSPLLLFGEGVLLVEGVVLPPAGALALCLLRPVGLCALLGLEGGLLLALLWTLSLIGLFALRCLFKGEGLLLRLPFPFGLVCLRVLALNGLLLACCLDCLN